MEPKVMYEDTTKKVPKESGCEGAAGELQCLRKYDAVKWWDSGRTQTTYVISFCTRTLVLMYLHWFTTHDGKIVPTSSLPLSGPLVKLYNIPVLVGTNRDEQAYLFPKAAPNSPRSWWKSLLL
jgi:hypothetical protein